MSGQMDGCGAGRRFQLEVWGRGLGWPGASPAGTSHFPWKAAQGFGDDAHGAPLYGVKERQGPKLSKRMSPRPKTAALGNKYPSSPLFLLGNLKRSQSQPLIFQICLILGASTAAIISHLKHTIASYWSSTSTLVFYIRNLLVWKRGSAKAGTMSVLFITVASGARIV